MLSQRPVGRGASARKYDLLTAMGALALSQGKHDQRRVLRLMTLINARYNWSRDELAVGQREIARLWSVDERTVKREMSLLRSRGWLCVRRQGARGRVAENRLQFEQLLKSTKTDWPAVGPDFDARMQATQSPNQNVVPLSPKIEVAPPNISDGDEWSMAQALLHSDARAVYASWLSALKRYSRSGGRLTLLAPSQFHAAYVQTHLLNQVLSACRSIDDSVSEVLIRA